MIKLHGKEYVEVKDRVASAHAEESYSMLKEESFEMGGRAYCRVYIEVKGKQYIGTAEIKFNAKANTPDGMSPYECGETSALGRALGFAGYGVVESIASADEVARNVASNGHGEAAMPPQAPTLEEIADLFKQMYEPEKWATFKQAHLHKQVANKDLTEADRVILWDKLHSIRESSKATSGK